MVQRLWDYRLDGMHKQVQFFNRAYGALNSIRLIISCTILNFESVGSCVKIKDLLTKLPSLLKETCRNKVSSLLTSDPSGGCIYACFSPARHCWNHYYVGSTVRSLECRMKEHTAALAIGKRQDIPFYAIVRTRGWMNDMVFGPVAFSTLPQCNLQVMEKLVITWSHARLNCPYARHKTSIFDHGSNFSSVSGSTDGTRRMRRRPTVSRRKGFFLTLPPNALRKFNDYKNELKILSLMLAYTLFYQPTTAIAADVLALLGHQEEGTCPTLLSLNLFTPDLSRLLWSRRCYRRWRLEKTSTRQEDIHQH